MDKSKVSLQKYDCIGFDLDNTLARYQIRNLVQLEYQILANFLIEQRRYPGEFLLKPLDTDFLLRGLIVDDELGNVLKISNDGTIIKAAHGTKWLNENEILGYYPTRHRDFVDAFVENPMTICYGTYPEKIRISLDYFDMPCSLAFARAVDTVENRCLSKKFSTIWIDIIDCLLQMFVEENFNRNLGGFYPEVKRHPEKYYYRCSQDVLNWLGSLKNEGKRLFLVTGAYPEPGKLTAENTIGKNWKDYFDIIICRARKPGFFTMKRDFLTNEFQENVTVNEKDLKPGETYTHGNWNGVKKILTSLSQTSNPNCLYIGDNLMEDIYAPKACSKIDTMCISEELEAENMFGYSACHPDKDILSSAVWGSFFYDNGSNSLSYWGNIMKKHSEYYAPSVDYLATLPLRH